MPATIRPYDIGCRPSPSSSGGTLLQDEENTYLLFYAVTKSVNASGKLDNLGKAVVNCKGCVMARFGYPNDEGRPEHPLGIADSESNILEVLNSPWCAEIRGQMEQSARRIWRDLYDRDSFAGEPLRHFIVLLKEMTFECLAESLVVEQYAESFDLAIEYVTKRLAR